MLNRIAIIGAGAAGCFCAIELKRRVPGADITVLEAGDKPLAKVAVTGGGRCNLTNTFSLIRSIQEAYPRGYAVMKNAFHTFGPEAAYRWFEREGVPLTVQDDGCVFPQSQDAMQIVRTLLSLMDSLGIMLQCGQRVQSIRHLQEGYAVTTSHGTMIFDEVVVTTGGSPKRGGLDFLSPLGLEIVDPVPSLFTFKLEDKSLRGLMGTVVDNATMSIPGAGFRSSGTLLITDWGLSGPATLKLSSYAARHLASTGYESPLTINWTGTDEQKIRARLQDMAAASPQRIIANTPISGFTSRLWKYMLSRASLREDIRWAELGKKGLNRLTSTLTADNRKITGRASFKEEFVTCGGISLECIDHKTLESRIHSGLFFAGEVLDIDAITGGFNLQAAWTSGYICACSASKRFLAN